MKTHRSVWFFRHGLRGDWESDCAPEFVHAKDNDLARAGVEQFGYCADFLATQRVDGLFSSPYVRCVHSAEVIARRIGKPILVETGLHESHGGEAPPLLSPPELHRRFPHVDPAHVSRFPAAGHESEVDWRLRGHRVIQALLDSHDGNLCIVSHGHPILAMQQSLLPGFRSPGMRCASYSRFDLRDGGWVAAVPYGLDHLGPVDISNMRHIDWQPG